MKNPLTSFMILVILLMISSLSCTQVERNPYWGDGIEKFEVQEVFTGERFPNVAVAMDGTVIATWGRDKYLIRRSEDGGDSWGPVIEVADMPGPRGFHGGGVTVDETSGAIFVFIDKDVDLLESDREKRKEEGGQSVNVYKSTDNGRTWQKDEIQIFPDIKGNIPSMHINERGITLKYGKHAGRLIRAARELEGSNHRDNWPNHYTNAIYSDDGGKTWYTSDPFPAYGTGEAAIEELSDGRLYYNSRRHWAPEGENARRRWIAWSYDGGETWEDLSVSDELPDGDHNRDYGLMGGLVRLPVENNDILIFSNIDSPEGRTHGTVWASFDGGETWPVKRLVEEGGFAYSSMAAGRSGTPSEGWIYLMYEGGDPYGYAYMARFNLAWVTGGLDWNEFLHN